MEQATEILAAVQCVVIGLSHMARPRAWVDFFVWLRGLGCTGVFANGMLSLSFGSIIVAFHNVWVGAPVVLTVFGWMQVLKGVMSLVFPEAGLKSLMRVSPERTREFVAAGGLFLLLGVIFGYLACMHGGR